MRLALTYINLPQNQKNIDNLKKEILNLKIDFNIVKSCLNWFLKPKKKKSKTIVQGFDTLDNFFNSAFHKLSFTPNILDEIERCLNYFTKPRITGLLDSEPKSLIEVEAVDFDNFSLKKISNEEKQIRGRLIGFLFNYASFRSKTKSYDAFKLTYNLKVEACIYCNRGYANTVISNKIEIIRPELDHFFAQHIYPILSLSFFNLIPSCHACNSNLKGSTPFNLKDYFHPYLGSFDKLNILFKYRPQNPSDFYPGIDDHLKVKLITSSVSAKFKKRVDNNISLFKLNEVYSSHELLIKELMKLKRYSNNTYLESIRTNIFVKKDGSPMFSTKRKIYETVLLNYYRPEDYHKRPMAKFIKDISIDLKII